MRRLILLAALFAPAMAHAQPAPDLVLIPRDVAAAALNWIGEPNPNIAVKLFGALSACIQDNPSGGSVTRFGADQCPAITAAIEARGKELTDLRKKLADAQTQDEQHKATAETAADAAQAQIADLQKQLAAAQAKPQEPRP